MKILLDTCTFLWITLDAPQLSEHARELFQDRNKDVYLSSIFVYEICVKCALGRLIPVPCGESLSGGLPRRIMRFMEIVFSITQEEDGGFVAECLSHDIFTQGNNWDELRANVREAVTAYFFDGSKPARIRLHMVRDEVLTSS